MLLGYTNMVSYPVYVRAGMFEGTARFVPAGDELQTYLDVEIDVEVAHERVDNLRISDVEQHHIVALAEACSFHVNGEVTMVVNHAEPPGNRTTYIVAGDAGFALSLADIGELRLVESDVVEFNVHGLSLWDEAI